MIKKLRFFFTLMLLFVGIGSALAETKMGTIEFGTTKSGKTSIDKASVTAKDNLENEWTIATTFSGQSSFRLFSDWRFQKTCQQHHLHHDLAKCS